MSKAFSRHINANATRAAILAAAAITATLTLTPRTLADTLPADGNGNYTQILCTDPTSGEGLGVGLPEGLTNPASIDTWQITTSWTNCPAGPITSADGIPLAVGQTNTYPQGTWSALLYQAPADSTINAGRIWRVEHAEGADNGFMGIDQQAGEYQNLYSLPRNSEDSGDWYTGNIASRGDARSGSQPLAPANVVNLTVSPDGSHWDVNATCDPNGNNNSSCTLNAQQWEYRIYAGEISLHAANDPQASNITGPLTTEDPLKGTETITFSATDQGPGLAYVKILAGGKTITTETIDSNGGRCVPIPGHDPYTWAYQTPCKTSVGGRTYSLDTSQLNDGEHHIQVIIEDAAGNQSTVLDRTVTVQNTPPTPTPTPTASTSTSLSSPAPGAGLLALSLPAAVANGTPASESAQLHLSTPTRISRSYAKRALAVSGRLTTTSGAAIANATLEVSEQTAGSTSRRVIAHGKTSVTGAFTIHIPGGPSRTLTIGYRAYSNDLAYAAQTAVHENVAAGVKLHVAPHTMNPAGTITLTGQVAGPIPHGGITVVLLVHYHHQWQPFRDPRTNSHGRFQIRYQFQGAEGRFPFRAQALAGQNGFPYSTGSSVSVDVTTR
ncbi:MAG TPA: hypothetical protein VLZ06_04720 [Solirubrobacteraceae bacterium]|nr:hypothetical protein [Solirubrobacteraceae bacterium]